MAFFNVDLTASEIADILPADTKNVRGIVYLRNDSEMWVGIFDSDATDNVEPLALTIGSGIHVPAGEPLILRSVGAKSRIQAISAETSTVTVTTAHGATSNIFIIE